MFAAMAVVCLVVVCTACGNAATICLPLPEETFAAGSSAAVVMQETRIAENTLHEAFYNVVCKLYETDSGLNHEIKYIAVDMTSVFENEREELEAALEPWAEALGCELLVDTFEGLAEAGHIVVRPIEEAGFRDGVLFQFGDVLLEGKKLTIKATKYRGPLGAVGAEFTVRFSGGEWVVGEPNTMWVA